VAKKVKELNDVNIIMISAHELDDKEDEKLKQPGYILDVIKRSL
jgi:hypothetical protein